MSTKRLNIDILARDKSAQALNGVRGNLDNVKKSVFNLRNALIGIGAGAVIKSFIDVGKEVESLQVRFKFLFGSAEEGSLAFDNLAKFASKVPFSLEEISRASGNLAVVAKDANDLNRILEITGNVASVTGLDFETTSSQIQRAFSGGIGSADLFRERGVRALLGFKQGATVTAEETVARFEELFSGDGKFAKATQDLATTLEGTLSMLGDKYFNFQKDVANEFFDELKKEFGDLNVFLEENADTIQEIAQGIGKSLAEAIILLGKAVKLTGDTFAYLNRPINEISYELFGMEKVVEMLRDKFPEATDAVDDFVNSLMGIKTGGYAGEIDTLIQANERLIKSRNKYVSTFDVNEVLKNVENLKKEQQQLLFLSKGYSTVNTELGRFAQHNQDNSDLIETLNKSKFPKLQQALQDAGDTTAQLDGLFTNTFNGFADTLADAILTGKFAFKDFANAVIADIARIIAKQLALLAVQKTLGFLGGGFLGGIGSIFGGFFADGGRPPINRPSIVGEKGAELFIPDTAGTIIPNNQLNGINGATTVNVNVYANDTQGFDDLLVKRRSVIVNVINDALNRQGREALI